MLKHRDNKTYHQSTKINTQKCSLAEQKHNLRTFLKGGRGKTNTPAVCSSSRSISFRSSASSFLSSVGIGFSSASSTEHTRNRTRSERVSEEGGGGGAWANLNGGESKPYTGDGLSDLALLIVEDALLGLEVLAVEVLPPLPDRPPQHPVPSSTVPASGGTKSDSSRLRLLLPPKPQGAD